MRQLRCDAFCREGADSKASKAFHSPGLLNPDDALGEMIAKHPSASQPPDLSALGPANVGLVPDIGVDDVRDAFKTFT